MVLVDVVVDELLVTAGAVVVVVEDDVCAKAEVSAIALTAPAANSVVNLFCIIICPLLWLNGCSPSCIHPTARSWSLFNRTFFSLFA